MEEFIRLYPTGSQLDTDGFPTEQPYQCFDAAIVYMRYKTGIGTLYIPCESSGYVKDWWNDFATNGLSQWFDQIAWDQKGLPGDICIWGNAPETPDSHVAILIEDKGTMQRVYGQNQPEPHTTIREITSYGLLGYLRPKGPLMLDENGIKNMYIGFNRLPATDADIKYWKGKPYDVLQAQLMNDSAFAEVNRLIDLGKKCESGKPVTPQAAEFVPLGREVYVKK